MTCISQRPVIQGKIVDTGRLDTVPNQTILEVSEWLMRFYRLMGVPLSQ